MQIVLYCIAISSQLKHWLHEGVRRLTEPQEVYQWSGKVKFRRFTRAPPPAVEAVNHCWERRLSSRTQLPQGTLQGPPGAVVVQLPVNHTELPGLQLLGAVTPAGMGNAAAFASFLLL